MTKSAWWESAYLWEAGTRALIKCRGRPITGSVIMLEQRSNFGLRRLVIHHLEKQEAGREINNKYISQCLDATDVLLGQAIECQCQKRWFWLAKDFGEETLLGVWWGSGNKWFTNSNGIKCSLSIFVDRFMVCFTLLYTYMDQFSASC